MKITDDQFDPAHSLVTYAATALWRFLIFLGKDPRWEQIDALGIMPLSEGFTRYLDSERISQRVRQLARLIAGDSDPERLVVIGILQGAMLFCADLARELDPAVRFDFIRLASYGDGQTSSGQVRLVHDPQTVIENQDVVVVDDIFDTGLTLRFARDHMLSRGARSVRTMALLAKGNGRGGDFQADWTGFSVKDGFYVGYGLDLAGRYRGLADIHRKDVT